VTSDFYFSIAKLMTATSLFLGGVVLADTSTLDPGIAKVLEGAVFAGFALYLLHYAIPGIVSKHEAAVTKIAVEHRETVRDLVAGHKDAVKTAMDDHKTAVIELRNDFTVARTQMGSVIEKALDSVADAHRAMQDKHT
jgi:hypothetical protein